MPLDAFFQTISTGDPAVVSRQIAQGADVVAPREVSHPRRNYATTQMTPLGWAAFLSANFSEIASTQIIASLLAAGAVATIGKPLLFASSRSAIEQLAQAKAALNDTMSDGTPDEVGSTALMFRA